MYVQEETGVCVGRDRCMCRKRQTYVQEETDVFVGRETDEEKYKQNGKIFSWCNFDSNFGREPFFFSPARHGEAQDMRRDLKRKHK